MSDFKNEFSWSVSRDALFRECRRKYYYNYYGYWGGWDKNHPDKTRRILYVLKSLQNRWQWKGSVVHHEIEKVLVELVSTGVLTPEEKSKSRVTEMMRSDYRYSRDGHYWRKDGSLRNVTALYEHEYKTGTSDEIWKQTHDEAVLCIENFYKSRVLDEIKGLPKEKVISIESMTASAFSFTPEKVFVKLDLAYVKGDGVEIVDWKTGAGEADRLQFLVYAIFACEEFEILPGQVSVTEYNLLGDGAREHRFSAQELNDGVEYIKESISSMKSMLANAEENIAVMTDFPRTKNEKTCESCSFRKICFELD
ncbi:MAG TPA: PD-(D/E)XK nuclease family protein [Thermodesulfobacteriota bacterium]|nr:PD-(D/E)XK nuclease family protein [Thermodesulfobacteriota bacterium]